MIKYKALAIALTLGMATATGGIAHASNAKSPAEFQVMIDKIHANQARQRARIKDHLATHRDPQFLAMLEKIHANQARTRANIKQSIKEAKELASSD